MDYKNRKCYKLECNQQVCITCRKVLSCDKHCKCGNVKIRVRKANGRKARINN